MSKRFLQASVAFFTLVLAILPAQAALAHPLGNFTINRYSRLELERTQTHLVYIVDRAEVPTFQEREKIDANRDGQISSEESDAYLTAERVRLQQNLHLTMNGALTSLQLVSQEISFPSGQGGLPTQRITLKFKAETSTAATSISYNDENFAGRLGWREVVVQPADGIVLKGDVATQDVSKALTQYPQDMLNSPLAVSSVAFQWQIVTATNPEQNTTKAAMSTQQAGLGARQPADPFTDLINLPELTLGSALLALGLAFMWGAVHALSPGHGKTIVAAYLIGQRATVKHALFLGVTTTITHTTGVFALGLITLFASRFIVPERLYPWLEVISGVLVVVLGVTLLSQRMTTLFKSTHTTAQSDQHAHNDFAGMHDHGDGRAHTHAPPQNVSWRNLLALGVSGGLLPCPSALVVMLSAIALQRVAFGLLLILVFSTGLAGVLIAIGILLVHAGRLTNRLSISRFSFVQPVLRVAPVFSAFVITLAGLAITARAVALTVPL